MSNLLLSTASTLLSGANSLASVATTAVSTLAQGAVDARNAVSEGVRGVATRVKEAAANALNSASNQITLLEYVGVGLITNPEEIPALIGNFRDALAQSRDEFFNRLSPDEVLSDGDLDFLNELVTNNLDDSQEVQAPIVRAVTRNNPTTKKEKLIALLFFIYLVFKAIKIAMDKGTPYARKWFDDHLQLTSDLSELAASPVDR